MTYSIKTLPLWLAILAFCLFVPDSANAQIDMDTRAKELIDLFTGPIALSLTVIALVIAGLAYAMTDGNKQQLYQVALGVAIAIFGVQIILRIYSSAGDATAAEVNKALGGSLM